MVAEQTVTVRLTADIEAPILQSLRDELRRELRSARIDHDRAKNAYVSPYSRHDAMAEFHQTRGYWNGIARAVEIVDELLERLKDV